MSQATVRAEMDAATADHAAIGLNKPQGGTISTSLADRLSSANLSARTSPATTTEAYFNLSPVIIQEWACPTFRIVYIVLRNRSASDLSSLNEHVL